MIRRVCSVFALLSLAACVMPPPQQQQQQGAAPAGGSMCPQACQNYARCKGVTDPSFPDQCSAQCAGAGADPALVQQAATGDCPTVIALFEGGANTTAGQGGVATAGATATGGVTCPAVQASGQDAQLAQLLSQSAWCHYSYSGTTGGGTEKKERIVLSMDGRAVSNGSSESSYSGDNRNQYGDQTQTWGAGGAAQSGNQGCWKVQGGQLQLSSDGVQWAAVPTSVTQNSNGYPIVNAGGKEYASCN